MKAESHGAAPEDAPTGSYEAPVRIVKRRPKNRKSQIAASSAEAFSALGYHAVSMEAIAAKVEISAAALYRHYPSKYALFRESVLSLGTILGRAAELPDDVDAADPKAALDHMLGSLITMAIAYRQSGSLYRWQSRYLEAADRRELQTQVDRVIDHIADLLQRVRPDVTRLDSTVLAAAASCVISSISDHHASLPSKQIERLFRSTGWQLLDAVLPSADTRFEVSAGQEIPLSFKHELLLKEAVKLFHERGYPEVGIEEIAARAGLPPSGVYRYFHSKSDILAAAFRRAAERVSAAIAPAVAASANSEEALTRLMEQYVAGAFEERELTFVYYAEIGNVSASDRTLLRNIQRSSVEEWAKLLVDARPELSAAEARFLVHAAFGLVVDLGRLARFNSAAVSVERVRRLTQLTLFGR
ncbi:TetR/AcrR family transcriptional regulator [Antrihabitans sp. NCIMB 15449]|uniref:TetR/AcrR family transcriptional regulator n=1 Tax=Antrihabitans spumae TaxID=3373370 RepID=A0ABW7JLU2_9NOCA